MPDNIGYLTADTSPAGDEVYTPKYAIRPLLKYIEFFKELINKEELTIWCPCDLCDSNYVTILKEAGYNVIYSHIDFGEDFLEWEPEADYDLIITNPPFSKKDKVLKRLYELGKRFAVLLPLPTLQGQKRFKYLEGCQALIFDKRINYFKNKETKEIQKGAAFASIYVCKDFLPQDLIFEELEVTNE